MRAGEFKMTVNNTVNNNDVINRLAQTPGADKRRFNIPERQEKNARSFQEILVETVKRNKVIASDLKVKQYALNKPELTVSKHARQRAEQRNIDIDEALEKIDGAVIKAAGKNLRNVLVLSDDAAFIVSVGNNVVVTAMSGEDMRENVITNIDGTVII